MIFLTKKGVKKRQMKTKRRVGQPMKPINDLKQATAFRLSNYDKRMMDKLAEHYQLENRSDVLRKLIKEAYNELDEPESLSPLDEMLMGLPHEGRRKRSIIVTDTTYNQFCEFAEGVSHITKNRLIELAVIHFMKCYRKEID